MSSPGPFGDGPIIRHYTVIRENTFRMTLAPYASRSLKVRDGSCYAFTRWTVLSFYEMYNSGGRVVNIWKQLEWASRIICPL